MKIRLPDTAGRVSDYLLSEPLGLPQRAGASTSRIAYSAAHVVADPFRTTNPQDDAVVDWDATLAYRRRLWDLGLAVAEAMDTAQRGMGLDWPTALELIQRSVREARAYGPGAQIACGAGTDHLSPGSVSTVDEVIEAYLFQCEAVEAAGGRIILMASRALAAVAKSADDYRRTYQTVLSQLKEPAILHWLGDMFDPALAGYWGADNLDVATNTALDVIADSANKIDGIKISLLDKQREMDLRRQLPESVRCYTGDDFNYPELIAGDEQGYSHALLGIFDAIAPAAAAALTALDAGDRDRYDALLAPTVPLSRHIFQAPTRHYKSGIVFLAWLNGHQSHFRMIGGAESARSIGYYVTLFRLADEAGLLRDPALAVARMRSYLVVNGVAD